MDRIAPANGLDDGADLSRQAPGVIR